MRNLKDRQIWRSLGLMTGAALIVSLASHLFLIGEWQDGRYFAGTGDGLSQMLPFKQMLYDLYSKGEFFYSESFGLGGGVYSQLGYYYASSLVFWLQCGITYVLEAFGIIGKPDLFYWANMIIPVSIARLTAVILAAAYYFRYMNFGRVASLLGASIYGTSIIYFRHTMYWEFFADAMIWLPLLLLGAERVMKRGKTGLFTIMVGISLFDNFYFAYINFLLVIFYLVVRLLVRLRTEGKGFARKIVLFLRSGLIGFLIGAAGFIPSVYGYLNNERPPYRGEIPIFEVPDNLLLSSRIVIVLAFTVFCLFLFSFYRNKTFRFFAILIIAGMLMHLSPFVASVFNGFSAPQYRWGYFLGLAAGGVAAAGLEMLNRLKWRQVAIALIGAGLLYFVFYRYDEELYKLSFEDWKQSYLLTALIIIYIAILAFFLFKKRRGSSLMLAALLIAVSVGTDYEFQKRVLAGKDSKRLPSDEFMHSEKYIGPQQVELIRQIQKREPDPRARIDWMIPTRNNTPIVEDFKGMSVYSSILNRELLNFYLHDLEIDMKRESVSRYATMGGRANLYALTGGKYMLIEKGHEATVPYGFKKLAETKDYAAYRNDNMLPFVRTVSQVTTEQSLANSTMLEREHAMLTGVILEEARADAVPASTVPVQTAQELDIEEKDAAYDGSVLKVTGKTGGIDIKTGTSLQNEKDLYVSFHLERLKNTGVMPYPLSVNDYHTSRKANDSIYRTYADDLTIRVPSADTVSIRLPKGKYELSNLKLQGEDYRLLQREVKREKNTDAEVAWDGGSKMKISLDNHAKDRYLVLPLPFEKGWRATVNGEKTKLLKANYAFTALPIGKGKNELVLKYEPPFFRISLLATFIGIALWILFALPYWKHRK